jgi:hypothetical protein
MGHRIQDAVSGYRFRSRIPVKGPDKKSGERKFKTPTKISINKSETHHKISTAWFISGYRLQRDAMHDQ